MISTSVRAAEADALKVILRSLVEKPHMIIIPEEFTDRLETGTRTFSSRALWCSNKDLSALRTSTSLETPEGDCACRLTTVIRSERSCRDTRHSRCSSSS